MTTPSQVPKEREGLSRRFLTFYLLRSDWNDLNACMIGVGARLVLYDVEHSGPTTQVTLIYSLLRIDQVQANRCSELPCLLQRGPAFFASKMVVHSCADERCRWCVAVQKLNLDEAENAGDQRLRRDGFGATQYQSIRESIL